MPFSWGPNSGGPNSWGPAGPVSERSAAVVRPDVARQSSTRLSSARHSLARYGLTWKMFAAVAVIGTLLAGCASSGSSLPALPETTNLDRAYVLGPGDHLKILV